MLNLNKTELDVKKLTEGTLWAITLAENGTLLAKPVDEIPAKDGWMRVIPPGVEYQRVLEIAQKPFIDDIRAGKLTDRQEAIIQGTALATLVKDWGNFSVGSDPVPYSHDVVHRMLTDLRWTNLRGIVSSIADHRKSLLSKQLEDAEGNSRGDLSGSSEEPTQVAVNYSPIE